MVNSSSVRSARGGARSTDGPAGGISTTPGKNLGGLASERLVFGKGLVGHEGEGVLDAGQRLQLLDDEMADIHINRQVALHQQVVLAGEGIDLRHLLDRLDRLLGDLVGPAEIA